MSEGLNTWRCTGCGTAYFPERYLCPACRGAAFERAVAATGTVEEISTIHHMLGQENWVPRRIASIRTDFGALITAGVGEDVDEGARVDLAEDDGAAFGRARRPSA